MSAAHTDSAPAAGVGASDRAGQQSVVATVMGDMEGAVSVAASHPAPGADKILPDAALTGAAGGAGAGVAASVAAPEPIKPPYVPKWDSRWVNRRGTMEQPDKRYDIPLRVLLKMYQDAIDGKLTDLTDINAAIVEYNQKRDTMLCESVIIHTNDVQDILQDAIAGKLTNIHAAIAEYKLKRDTMLRELYGITVNMAEGSATYRGLRDHQEDRMNKITNLMTLLGVFSIVGVYDGHGGYITSETVSEGLPQLLKRVAENATSIGKLVSGIKAAFIMADRTMTNEEDGTCAEVFMDLAYHLVFAKVGDSISIIVNRDGSYKVVGEHHKGCLPEEKARCEAAGFDIYKSRVDGYLAVSRAIGDKCLKHSYDREAPEHLHAVTAIPTVNVVQKTGQEWFVIIASDGIYEGRNTVEDTVKIAYDAMTGGLSEGLIAAEIIFNAQFKGSTDNISAVISKIAPFIPPALAGAVAEATPTGAAGGAGAGAAE